MLLTICRGLKWYWTLFISWFRPVKKRKNQFCPFSPVFFFFHFQYNRSQNIFGILIKWIQKFEFEIKTKFVVNLIFLKSILRKSMDPPPSPPQTMLFFYKIFRVVVLWRVTSLQLSRCSMLEPKHFWCFAILLGKVCLTTTLFGGGRGGMFKYIQIHLYRSSKKF